MMSPVYSSGQITVTFPIGSRRIGLAFGIPALNANLAAASNELGFESTGWYEPSYRVALTLITLHPARGHLAIQPRRPA